MKISVEPEVTIVGAGLAGTEAAWQLAQRGHQVRLHEMRPEKKSEAHHTGDFAELVCSNSLRGADLKNAVGLLKEEMRVLDSLIMRAADRHSVPGGGALVVDREGFAKFVTQEIQNHPRIEICHGEISGIASLGSQGLVLLATGPLTSPALAENIRQLTGSEYLYFYDSIAPIVEADSINLDIAFRASRYDKGEADYLNCPMNREEYEAFVAALVAAEKVATKEFEKPKFFEGCLPVEVMAERGRDTLAFGPMKPVGLIDPRTGLRPHAVVQLRQDNLHATLYNMVGFQTRMKYPEQKRVFGMIPGLEKAEFVRLGSMHRNTFIHSPVLLSDQLELKSRPGLFLAGQMIGVEGYVESASMGLYAGMVLADRLKGRELKPPPPSTALGALVRHVTGATGADFQPMNINFGLLEIPKHLSRKERRLELAEQALAQIAAWNLGNLAMGGAA
ncbi:MAG: methylenetetrahydrofolate--tRNA-(uracil(54)-C(5))-methyltransferase (FADH(2)-oxidizing) TrmFO [Deltaproteobacteria bacterium]|nr:methylenetetrahydrofolate--tRNA-(uracil(54)-C(5))-methyltransferase (FADH(2)-oxidizing) TrmFO [Deltaproteobacteria bacterium]